MDSMAKSEKNRSQSAKAVPRKVKIEQKRACMVATNTDGSVVPLMSAREISNYLGVSRTTLRRYVQNGIIPFIKIGGLQRFDVLAVRSALDRNS
jgi:excisionase family DNA binding protein